MNNDPIIPKINRIGATQWGVTLCGEDLSCHNSIPLSSSVLLEEIPYFLTNLDIQDE